MTFLVAFFLAAIILDHAHLVSPMVLAWSRAGFRKHMIERPGKWLLLPGFLLGAAIWVGLTSTRYDLSFTALVLVYWWWNLIHFALQNYGLMRLLRVRGWLAEAAAVATAFLLAILPWALPGPWVLPILLGVSWLHWVTDIVLSASRAARWAFFLVGVLVVGASGFLWKSVSTDPHICNDLATCMVVTSIPFWLSLRIGLSFVHFLYSRWVWQAPIRGFLQAT